MIQIVLCAMVAFVLAAPAFAAQDQKASAFVLCKNQKNVRTIRILPEQKDSCSVTYTKGGVEEVVGAKKSSANCKSLLANIQSDLEDDKWSCRSVRSAQVTTGSELSQQ